MKRVMFVTYNDPPSGIYNGQVIDVCDFLQKEFNVQVTLIAFISLRGYFATREKLKSGKVCAHVLPMFPGPQRWKRNSFLLRMMTWLIQPDTIIARGPFACSLALKVAPHKRVVFDARGAYDAEFNEYDVSGIAELRKDIFEIEKNAVLNSSFRIAVSYYLVRYWNSKFGYTGQSHVVIPCTLNSAHETNEPMPASPASDEVTIVYSGSVSGWQTLLQLDELLYPLLERQKNLSVLLLIPQVPASLRIAKDFSARVEAKWVSPREVPQLISRCDYGWLVREKSVTNEVASPVKFAEYLAAGLKVITTPFMGDNTDFVKLHDCGIIVTDQLPQQLTALTQSDRKRNAELATTYFTKDKYKVQYRLLLTKGGLL